MTDEEYVDAGRLRPFDHVRIPTNVSTPHVGYYCPKHGDLYGFDTDTIGPVLYCAHCLCHKLLELGIAPAVPGHKPKEP